MATWKAVCDLAGRLPGAEPGSRLGKPCWRVRGRVIVQLDPGLRVPDGETIRRTNGGLIVVTVPKDERDELIREDPKTFFITQHYLTSNDVLVWLRRIDTARLREVLTDAWRHRATKQMIRAWDNAPAASASARRT